MTDLQIGWLKKKTSAPANLPAARWRLILGKFADQQLPGGPGSDGYQRMDMVLEYLYGREYRERGVRPDGDRGGSLDPSQLSIPGWIREVRELFPKDTVEVIERHALERYNMTALVTDAEILKKLEPNYELLKAVLTFKDTMQGEVLEVARRIVRQVVEEIIRKLASEVRQALWGRLNRNRHTNLKSAKNLDWRRTIRANLKNYNVEQKSIVLETLHFYSRTKTHTPWHIIIAIDCSGSMIDSVIHSAVMAAIFKGLPSTRVNLVAFDTSVVDLSEAVDDPTQVLMSVQLGGGTNIAGALGYCETLVTQPSRTILVLVTDFCEGASPNGMLASIKRLRESGVKVLGLAALDSEANPNYDHQMAERCAAAGAEIAALTPLRLAEWIEKAIS
jgi:Mg-chelatase subunit ChlD